MSIIFLCIIQDEQFQSQSNIVKTNRQTTEIIQQANELTNLLQTKHNLLDEIHYCLTNLTNETKDTNTLFDELSVMKNNFDDKQEMCHRLQKTIDNFQLTTKKTEEQLQIQMNKNQTLEKAFEQQKIVNNELQQENTRLSTLNAKQMQDIKHLEQLRQSILTFEKKLDQKQTRVNELSMKIIETKFYLPTIIIHNINIQKNNSNHKIERIKHLLIEKQLIITQIF